MRAPELVAVQEPEAALAHRDLLHTRRGDQGLGGQGRTFSLSQMAFGGGCRPWPFGRARVLQRPNTTPSEKASTSPVFLPSEVVSQPAVMPKASFTRP